MTIEKLIDENKIPRNLNAPWLNDEYVKKYGWFPVKYESEFINEVTGYVDTEFGSLPCKDIRSAKPGDIVMFFEYEEELDENEPYSDRFEVITDSFWEEILQNMRGAPNGIIIPQYNQS